MENLKNLISKKENQIVELKSKIEKSENVEEAKIMLNQIINLLFYL